MTTIVRWPDLAEPAALVPEIERIFFAAAAREYARGPERNQFRERWLGRYLERWPGEVFLATEQGALAGYLVGCLENPATSPVFDDLPYYRGAFAELCARHPAQLHVNIDEARRGTGIGSHLVTAFLAHARDRGAPGVHIVTGKGMRNVRFYERCGFAVMGEAARGGGTAVFMGRAP